MKWLLFIGFALLASCTKERFSTDAALRLSAGQDTLRFDTVFTATGSVTRSLKIFNNNNEGIRISRIALAGGAASPFKINVNGQPGPVVSNVSIAGGDSAYLFAMVTINPNNAAQPFLLRDSVAIEYNGNKLWLQLQAYGQNARFLRNSIIKTNQVWDNRLPYVLLGNAFTIDTAATLTIQKGTRIFINATTPFIVNGSLQVLGEKGDSNKVTFAGDRLDEPYRDYPAAYPGIIFSTASKNNFLQYAVIKNAYQALVVAGPNSTAAPKLQLFETVIENTYDAAIVAGATSIEARNVVVANSGKGVQLLQGGAYNFTHCTLASFGNSFIEHKAPTLFISNAANGGSAALSASFRNCIIWGDSSGLVRDEVAIDKTGSASFSALFDAVLWRVRTVPAAATAFNISNNLYPEFDTVSNSKRLYNLRLKMGSPAIDKGKNFAVLFDADGARRPVGAAPDLGAYEKQ